MQKRALAIHDISCVGKCSLTVALPILSAAGIECSVLPTAVLSTHTGGFTGYTFRDLTDEMAPITAHWKSLDLAVDSIYTGYLGSEAQLELVKGLIRDFRKENTVVLVDPVMADGGKLYPLFTMDFVRGMCTLCKMADIIVPNLTEATLMLGEPYREDYDRAYIEGLLRRLSALGPKKVVLSGVSFEKGKLGAAAFDRKKDEISYTFAEQIPGYYHGTGDVFGSALLCGVLNGFSLADSARIAVEYTVGCIRRTYAAKTDIRFGVDFENETPTLLRLLGKI